MLRYVIIFLLIIFAGSCRPPLYSPKPAGYFRIDTPASHAYRLFDWPDYPYTFEYPVYSNIEKDTIFQNEKEKNAYWINIVVPSLNGVINITYKDITPSQPFDSLVEGSWALSFFHHEKAEYIDQSALTNPNGAGVVIYTVGGNTASRYQFTVTDSVKHFIRGALYFDVTPNADSLKPATDFLMKDIMHMMKTLKFK
jgi:gliding motility-associated lipoprotein GldD